MGEYQIREIRDGDIGNAILWMDNFNRIAAILNQGISFTNCDPAALLLNAVMHGDLGTGSNKHDTDEIYHPKTTLFSTNVTETSINELATAIGLAAGVLPGGAISTAKYIGYDFDATTPNNVLVSIAANTAANALLINMDAELTLAIAATNSNYYLPLELSQDGGAYSDLSSGGTDGRFYVRIAAAGAGTVVNTLSRAIVIDASTVPGIDFTKINAVRVGAFTRTAGEVVGAVANISLSVFAL